MIFSKLNLISRKTKKRTFFAPSFKLWFTLFLTQGRSNMHAILAARNSRHELWDQNRFTSTWHLKPVNVSKHHILVPKTNQTDWRQPFNVFRSQISFLFCSKIIYLFRSITLAYETCATNLHTTSMSQEKEVQIKLYSSFIFLNEAVDQ